MCLIKNITYVHPDNRRESQQQVRRCSRAPTGALCPHVEYRDHGSARVVEVQPSSHVPASPSRVTSADPRFFPLSKRASRRLSKGSSRRQVDSKRTSMETPPSPSPARPSHKTFLPRAPSPPSPKARAQKRVSFDESAHLKRTLGADGTAFYSRPPSINMPRATINERAPSDRRSSISSLTNEIDDTEPPQNRSSTKHSPRATFLEVRPDLGRSAASFPGPTTLPRIGRPREDPIRYLPLPTSPARMSREEQNSQVRILKTHFEETDKPQRKHSSREAISPSRSQETSRERRDRHRRDAQARLCGQSVPTPDQTTTSLERERERELHRRLAAEKAQASRDRTSWESRNPTPDEQQLRSSSSSSSPSPLSATNLQSRAAPSSNRPSGILSSARTYTNVLPTATKETRAPPYRVQVHHYPDRKVEDLLARRGERMLLRTRNSAGGAGAGRTSGDGLEEAVAGMSVRDSIEFPKARDSGISFSPVRGEGKKDRKELRRRRREEEEEEEEGEGWF